jgi:hypothetical protein
MTEETPGQGKPRGGNGQFTRSVDTVQRDALAARLRARNATYKEIAERLRYESESGAYKAVQRALAAVPVEDVTELRAIECERLDEIARRLWSVFDTKYPLINGRREFVDKQGAYVEDPRHLLTIVDRLLRISERRAKLLGLDASPPKREAEEPRPAGQQLAGGHVAELLRALFSAFPFDPAEPPAVLALPTAVEKNGETR